MDIQNNYKCIFSIHYAKLQTHFILYISEYKKTLNE